MGDYSLTEEQILKLIERVEGYKEKQRKLPDPKPGPLTFEELIASEVERLKSIRS